MISKILSALLLLGVATASIASAQTTYIAFGDSITEGFGDDDPARVEPEDKGYPARLEDLLENSGRAADVENHGFGGERTVEAVTRIGPILQTAGAGDVLLLMEGTNDITRNIGIESTLFNLDEMANRAERRGIQVVHATVIPRIPEAEVDQNNYLTQQLNGLIRNLAGVRQRGLADPFEVFLREANLFARLYANAPKDPVGHPNGAGYDVLADVFFDVLTGVDSVPPVHGVMRPVNGQRGVQPATVIDVDVWDFGQGIDLSATSLLVNGEVVPATVTGDAKRIELLYQPPQPLRGSVSIGLRSRDLATPPNTVDREIARFRTAGTALLDGDLNEDGRVDGTDLVSFARHFGAGRGERRFERAADFNEDGRIDGQDLAALAANFGKTSF
ncbi:MAG TPA: GDSL-type esterase/lipase family protein [Thermoanaerobaculia bacterium]|nr:GDSL-type esterase/lipase family protein [Thermoanaerobaculia bacterium]